MTDDRLLDDLRHAVGMTVNPPEQVPPVADPGYVADRARRHALAEAAAAADQAAADRARRAGLLARFANETPGTADRPATEPLEDALRRALARHPATPDQKEANQP